MILWEQRIKWATETFREWRDDLPDELLMDKVLKASGTRDLVGQLKDAEERATALENQLQQMRESYARYVKRSTPFRD